MARTLLFAVVAVVVAMTQVASAQVGRRIVTGPGFVAVGVRGPGFVAGGTLTPFQANRGFAAATPFGLANGGVVINGFGSVGAVNTVGPFGAASAQGFNGLLANGGQFQAVGPVGAVSAGQLNGFGRSLQGATFTGAGGNTIQVGRIVGPNGTLNMVRGPAGNTVFFRGR